jgi:hypothetical protein
MQQKKFHEADCCSTSPDNLRLISNKCINERFHKTPLLECTLDQLSEVHILINYFFTISFNIILPPW